METRNAKRKREEIENYDPILEEELTLSQLNAIVDEINGYIAREDEIEDVHIEVGEDPTGHQLQSNLTNEIVELNATNEATKIIDASADVIDSSPEEEEEYIVNDMYLNHFTTLPKKDEIVFLYIATHGMYPVMDDFTYDIFHCPVSKVIRLQYAPLGTLATMFGISEELSIQIDLTDALAPTLTDVNVKQSILNKLFEIANNNKKDPKMLLNYPPDPLEERLMRRNIHKSNTVITNKLGEQMLNKLYLVDSSGEGLGITILFDVTFKLPDIFFSENIESFNYLVEQEIIGQRFLTKGNYNKETREITYYANSELLSCPYFHVFNIIDSDDGDDGDDNGPHYFTGYATHDMTKVNMLPRITTKQLFRYFQYSDMVVNLDYTCSSLNFSDSLKQKLKKRGKTTYTKKINKELINRQPGAPRGGHIQKTKKRRTKKRRTTKRQTTKRQTTKRRKNKQRRKKQRKDKKKKQRKTANKRK